MKCTRDCLNCELPECIYDNPENENVHVFITGHCVGIGERLKKALKDKGMKQRELAEKIGVTEATISQYACDTRPPRSEHVIAICKILGTSADWLLGLDNED